MADNAPLIAAAIALNLPVFPCSANKKPSWWKEEGGHGFRDASVDPAEIARLFSHKRAKLIGVPTGPRSGLDVLDLDYRHGAASWEEANLNRLPETRLHRTQSGGRHMVFRHAPGVRNSAGTIAPGVDVRGDGGYIIVPPSNGYAVDVDAEPAEWPDWLLDNVLPKGQPEPRKASTVPRELVSNVRMERIVSRALDRVRGAGDGQKHYALRNQARLLGGLLHYSHFSSEDAERWLLDALPSSIKDRNLAEATARWGLNAGQENPIELEDRPPPFYSERQYEPPAAEPEQSQPTAGVAAPPRTRWGDPVDFLADNSMAAPVLEQQHTPDALWPFIIDTSNRMGVDPAAVALAALVSCSSVISDNFELQPKRHDYTWVEQARIWGAIVGEPSILKTPIIAACTKPIIKLETDARQDHAEMMRAYQTACEAAAKAKPPEPFPPRPKRDRFIVESITPEALSEVLRDDAEGKFNTPLRKVLCRHDEMSEFFGGLDKYKSGGNGGSERGSYLRLYNGGFHTVDRIGRGSFSVSNWSATFLGGVQPGPIQRIARDAADDGLLQRFNFAVPSKQEKGADVRPDHDAVDRYNSLFPALATMRPAQEMATGHTQTIVLAEGSHEHRERIDALAEAMTHMPDTSKRLVAAFGKWPGLFARLCLTFHLIEVADARANGQLPPPIQVVQPATAERVAEYMRGILLPHLLRAEAVMFSTDQTSHAKWVAGFILAHRLEQIATRDIVRSYRVFKAPEAQRELAGVMRTLVSVGWLEPDEPGNPAKPVTTWFVNPAVHTLFAQRAEEEKARRAAVKEKIAETVQWLRTKKATAA